MLKSILLDYIDVDISFIYETQLKIELSADLKCQYHYHILSCQHLNWKWWLCKQKYPLQKCSGAFSIRQNNARCVRSHTPVSKNAFVKPGQLTLVSGHSQWSWSAGSCSPFQQDGSALASYQFFQEFRLSPSIMNLGHCLCAKPELSRWIFGAGRSTWGDKPVLGSVSVLSVEALALPNEQGVSGFIKLIHPLSVSDFLRVFWNEISQPAFGTKRKHKNPYISLKAIFTY